MAPPKPTENPKKDESIEALKAQLAALQAQNEKLKAASEAAFPIKMSDKGAVVVRGLSRRWPATFYPGEWLTLFEMKDRIVKFIEENKAELDKRGKESRAARDAEKEEEGEATAE